MIKFKIRQLLLVFAALVVAFTIPLWIENLYIIHLSIMICLNVVFAISLALILKMGNLSLGHAAYIGAGAYTSSMLAVKVGLPFWLTFYVQGLHRIDRILHWSHNFRS